MIFKETFENFPTMEIKQEDLEALSTVDATHWNCLCEMCQTLDGSDGLTEKEPNIVKLWEDVCLSLDIDGDDEWWIRYFEEALTLIKKT